MTAEELVLFIQQVHGAVLLEVVGTALAVVLVSADVDAREDTAARQRDQSEQPAPVGERPEELVALLLTLRRKLFLALSLNVVAVVTMPDKPAGRGRQLQQSDVKRFAVERGLPVLQPVSLKDEAFLAELKALEAQLFIVIAFRMLPEAVWQMPPLGTFNLHASLLPRYRGAAPINWAVMNGDTETGVTTFFLKHEIDTGDVIQQRSCPIGRHDDVEAVHDRLMVMGADMVVETVDAIIDGMDRPENEPYNRDKFYAVLNGDNTHLVQCQYYHFDRQIQPLSYFLKQQ